MTSGEYAYDLLRRLQRQFRCTDSGHRMYLYNFFGEIFNDPSVTITESAYNAFREQMDSDAALYAEKGLTSLGDIYNDSSFGASFQMLQGSFASIGIILEKQSTGTDGKLIFTLPNGTVKEITDGQGLGYSYLCARTGTEYFYAQQMMPFYSFEDDPMQDLADIHTNVAGYGTTWAYDGEGELEISGAGSMASTTLYYDLGIKSAVTSVIIGAGINRLMANALDFGTTSVVIVFLHNAADEIVFDSSFAGTSTATIDVYTDCEAVKQVDFGANKTVTYHPLSEWAG